MKKLNEDINRIKQLMLVESDEQLSFDFDSDETIEPQTSTPLSLESNKFTSSYRDKVFDILKDLYGSSNWSTEGDRGPKGEGGVVNIHTVYDLLKKRGLDDYEEEGGDWSILNYFDTNPKVRGFVVLVWEKETGKKLDTEEKLEEFLTWMDNNKERLFKSGKLLNHMIKTNITSLYNGELNERKAYEEILKLLEKLPNWELSKRFLPGSSSDRKGVDIIMKNKKTGKEAKFQVKPLASMTKTDDGYKVISYNISDLEYKPVDYFVFASKDSDDVFIFKNDKSKYKVIDSKTIVFDDAPIKF